MSNLVKHAERELRAAGYSPDMADLTERNIYNVTLRIVQLFSHVGHSGGSAQVHTEVIHRLLKFEPLGPITVDFGEWMHIDEAMAGRPDCWQNRRDGRMFSNDGGKTYYNVDELRCGWRAKLFGRVSKRYTSARI